MRRARRPGKVHLVGAGPGDPRLITVRGAEVLGRAGVVIADALAPPELLRLAPDSAERIDAGKRGGGRRVDQERINRLMIDRARRGLVVVRLKGGDPSLFGRGGEESEALARAGIPFEVVPGVTAALGAAACAGIPLTDRRHAASVVFATAQTDPKAAKRPIDWKGLAGADTVVLYMSVAGLASAVARLLKAGRPRGTPAVLVRWATRPEQRVLAGSLGTIARRARRARLLPPALLIVGEVARSRRRLDWFGRRALSGRTIVVTRSREQAASFAALLAEEGARVLEAPAIALRPPRSWAPLDRALERVGGYDYLIFTSVNGVARFFERWQSGRRDVRDLKGIAIVAIGPATAAALEARGLRVAVVPEEFRAEGLERALRGRPLAGARVLIARAAVARDLLVRALRRRGARVDVVPVYRTVASHEGAREVAAALRAGEIDLLTFTSSSTVERFTATLRRLGLGRRLRRVPAAVIGPITARAARRSGLRVVLSPRRYTVPALAEAIIRRFRSSPSGIPRGS